MRADGWIYDAYPEQNQITLWLRTDHGQTIKLSNSYQAELYATPKNHTATELSELIASHPLVESTSTRLRYNKISDETESETVRIITEPSNLTRTIHDLDSAGLCKLYNTDLSPIQRYFFTRNLTAFGKFQVEYEEEFAVKQIRFVEDDIPPQLCFTQLELTADVDGFDALFDSRTQILALPQEQRPRLYAALSKHGKSISYTPRPIPGKVIVNSEDLNNLGIAGLDEKSRFAFLPIGTVASWSPAQVIDSRQCYEALSRGVLIPRTRTGTATNLLTAKEVAYTDRGALILSPKVGLHENTAELDFESLFPSIILKHKISYEAVNSNGVLPSAKEGLLSAIVRQFLERRLTFKHRKETLPQNTTEHTQYEQREQLLKKLLVSLYGYSSSDFNRFSNPFVYREVNRIARDTIVKAMNIALREGFELLYLDTDSIFVTRNNATLNNYQSLSNIIQSETGLPISVANHYRYLVLLPQETDPEIEAARRFYGKLTNNQIHYRGIELRRHDSPPFLKQFQKRLLEVILDSETALGIPAKQLIKAKEFTVETLEKLRSGDVPIHELTISKVLRMPIERYRSLFPHVTAAVQLRQKNRQIKPGDLVNYVYVDTQQLNPMNRIAPAEFAETYDADKYCELLLDVAESILGVFQFSRTQLGFQRRTRSFLDELRSETTKEILLELGTLQP